MFYRLCHDFDYIMRKENFTTFISNADMEGVKQSYFYTNIFFG